MSEGTEPTEAEMVTEMNSKEQSAAFKSVKLRHCTRNMNEIKTMMKDDVGVHNINEGVAEFKRMLDEFKVCHQSVQKLLLEDVRENETLDWSKKNGSFLSLTHNL